MEIKRTIPKGSSSSRDFKTKKIFVGGIPTSVDEGNLLTTTNVCLDGTLRFSVLTFLSVKQTSSEISLCNMAWLRNTRLCATTPPVGLVDLVLLHLRQSKQLMISWQMGTGLRWQAVRSAVFYPGCYYSCVFSPVPRSHCFNYL